MSEWQRWTGIMKAYPFEESRLARWQSPYIVQIKYDGDRCRAVPIQTGPKGNEYLLLTSEENIFYSVPHINTILANLGLRAELDGELYNHEIYKQGGHEAIHSIVSRTVNLHPDYPKMQFHLFDIVNDHIQMRRQLLIEALKGLSPWIQVAPFWLCENLDDIKRVYDKIIEMGYEGIIVRHQHAQYARKRSIFVMKFKPKKQDKYKIVGWREEISKDGIPKGRIGSLIMQSQDGDNFGVSAGLNDGEREKYWLVRNSLAGKYAIIHYQHLTNRNIPKGTFDVEILEEVKPNA